MLATAFLAHFKRMKLKAAPPRLGWTAKLWTECVAGMQRQLRMKILWLKLSPASVDKSGNQLLVTQIQNIKQPLVHKKKKKKITF